MRAIRWSTRSHIILKESSYFPRLIYYFRKCKLFLIEAFLFMRAIRWSTRSHIILKESSQNRTFFLRDIWYTHPCQSIREKINIIFNLCFRGKILQLTIRVLITRPLQKRQTFKTEHRTSIIAYTNKLQKYYNVKQDFSR